MTSTYKFNVIKNVNEEFSISLPDTFSVAPNMVVRFLVDNIDIDVTSAILIQPSFEIEIDPIIISATPTATTTGPSGPFFYDVTSDNCWNFGGTFYSASNNFRLGNNYGDSFTIWLPFVLDFGVETIAFATLHLVCSQKRNGNLLQRVGCDKRANANVTPTGYNDLNGRVMTNAYKDVSISLGQISEGNTYNFDVTDALQEVVNLVGWTGGNTLAILIRDRSPYNANHYFAGYNHPTYDAAILEVSY